jgi:hypothetical protein
VQLITTLAHLAAVSELTELQPQFVDALKNATKEGKQLSQPVLVLYSDAYDTDFLPASVNDAWTKITQKDTTYKNISPKAKVAHVRGGRYFSTQEIAPQIQSFLKTL